MGEIRLDKMSGSGPGFYPALFLESGMKKQQNDFLNGSILPSLLRFAGPVLLALFLQAMYGAVDLIVVGKFAGSTSLAAEDSWDRGRAPAPRAATSKPPSAAIFAPARSAPAGDQASARLRAWACLRAANGVSSYREPRRASPADTKFGSRCENPVNPLGRSVIVLPPQTAAPYRARPHLEHVPHEV